jgi:hypothetical protein
MLVCQYFKVNPAHGYLSEAARRIIRREGPSETIVGLQETAIRMGLPEDDEVWARMRLAGQYSEMARRKGEDARGVHYCAALKQVELAVKLDSRRNYGFFEEPFERGGLPLFAAAYTLRAHTIDDEDGADAAISYLEDKLSLFQHVRGDPMWQMIFALGCLYLESRGGKEKAWAYFERVVHAETIPRVYGWEEDQAEITKLARKQMIALARSLDRS